MSDSPNDLATRSADRASRDLRPLASSAWVVVLLAGILGWSWLIRTEPLGHRPPPTLPNATAVPTEPTPARSTRGAASAARADRPERVASPVLRDPGEAAVALPGPRAGSGTTVTPLADRALRDASRLRAAGSWTRQVGLYCNPAAVERLLAGASESPSSALYVLSVSHDGRDCYRVCWGAFPDRRAADAAEVPAAVLAGNRPHSRAVTEVVP